MPVPDQMCGKKFQKEMPKMFLWFLDLVTEKLEVILIETDEQRRRSRVGWMKFVYDMWSLKCFY